jgi:cell division septation protein DedD
MGSSRKRGGAGERVLEGRHVIGLFMLMLLFSGVFFTLGYVMGRNQYDGQVRAASGKEFGVPDVLPKNQTAPKTPASAGSKQKPTAVEPASDSSAPSSSEWEFYHAGDSGKTDDHLRPAVSTQPIPASKGAVPASQPSAVSKTSTPSPRGAGGMNLQVAALTRAADATALANSLHKKGFQSFVQPPQGDKYYHVMVGPYYDQKSADNARKGLEVAGFKAIVKH